MSNVREFYARLGITLLRSAGSEAPARCFASPNAHRHNDRRPSMSVNLETGAWLCHACAARGGAYDAALLRGHTPRSAMDLLISHELAEPRQRARRSTGTPKNPTPVQASRPEATQPLATEAQIAAWHQQLCSRADLVDRLARERLIGGDTIRSFELGLDGKRITIPVRDAEGDICGLLRWLPFNRGSRPKMLAIPGTRRDLFPAPEQLPPGPILICEGEPDALTAHTAGLPAAAIPGVAAWRPAWATRFTGRAVTIVLDCDPEGRSCARRVAQDLATAGITATALDLAPDQNDGYDLTDHLLAGGSLDTPADRSAEDGR